MNKNSRRCLAFFFSGIFASTFAEASMPLLSITPTFKAPTQLLSNSYAAAIYQVTNNTKTITSFKMQPISGVTQITNLAGACADPIILTQGQTCSLYLRINGSQMGLVLSGGPVVCNNSPNPLACSQPSAENSLSVALSWRGAPAQNNWIAVLIAEDAPPANTLSTYVQQIITLAPKLEQIHLRVSAGATDYSTYVDLIQLLRTTYPAPILIGFHPDNSSSSYSNWNCGSSDSACVLNKSIAAMNAVNALVDPKQQGLGFNIFSLEQGYVEIVPSTLANYQAVKACLNPAHKAPGAQCPVCTNCTPQVTIASPVVTFGNAAQSIGDSTLYGPSALDYAYPQYYNLGERIYPPYNTLLNNGYFPTDSWNCQQTPPTTQNPWWVVDVDNGSSPYSPQIPCLATGQSYPDVFTYPNPTTQGPNPGLAAAYVAYILTFKEQISDIVATNGSQVYTTFSGEPQFLGAPGWTLDLILAFYEDLYTDFNTLYTQYPALFAQGVFANGVNTTAIKYGIWNFSSILANNP